MMVGDFEGLELGREGDDQIDDLTSFHDSRYDTLLYAYFVLAVVISNIILLNLIISLISDTYTKVHARSESLKFQHRARLILEFFDFTSKATIRKLQKKVRHTHVLSPVYDGDDHFLTEREKTHQIWTMTANVVERQEKLENAIAELSEQLESAVAHHLTTQGSQGSQFFEPRHHIRVHTGQDDDGLDARHRKATLVSRSELENSADHAIFEAPAEGISLQKAHSMPSFR